MSHHTWAHAIVRPVIRALRFTPVRPNHLTGLRLATGVASCLLLATGDPGWMDIGGGLFLVSFFLDRADGELARQSNKSSLWGHRFDLVSDYASNILIFAGLGVGLRYAGMGLSAIFLGLVAGVAIAGIFGLVSRIERSDGPTAAAFPTAAGFDPDDAMLVVPIALWSGAEAPLLVAAAVGAPAFLLWTCFRFRRHRGHPVRPAAARRASIQE
jgi:phosphatidylglycerophosphate synthase